MENCIQNTIFPGLCSAKQQSNLRTSENVISPSIHNTIQQPQPDVDNLINLKFYRSDRLLGLNRQSNTNSRYLGNCKS
ncbi:V-type proton ATPase subunit [Trichinella spiralis]|uniref:V-type proton ATPase subunit n=1 Tax=Trichinella spiralis TaxID=6334 RepID=A0ABR3KWX1_TRISP